MADDLTLKALIEAVLDAKGFEEFRSRVQSAGDEAARGSARVGGLGDSSDRSAAKLRRLGENIPAAGVAIFTQNLIRATVQMGGTERAVGLLSQAAGALALTLPGVGLAAGTALGGLGLLISVITALREETAKLSESFGGDEGFIENLTNLESRLGSLRPVFAQVLQSQKDLVDKGLRQQISAQAELREDSLKNITALEQQKEALEKSLSAMGRGDPVAGALFEKLRSVNTELLTERDRLAAAAAEIAKLITIRSGSIQALEAEADAFEEAGKTREEAQKKAAAADRAESERLQKTVELHRKNQARFEADLEDFRNKERRSVRERLIEQGRAMTTERETQEELSEAVKAGRREQMQTEAAALAATFSNLSAAFPQTKSFAIAEALINTFQGVTAVLADETLPTPLRFALAASVAALGLAQVAKIRQTEPGGFDLPRSDFFARHYGEKWANDLLFNLDAGFARALGRLRAPGSGPVTQITRQTTINSGQSIGSISMGGFFGTNETELLKQLERRLIAARRLEKRTTLRA